MTLNDIHAAFAQGDGRCHSPRVLEAIESWMVQHAIYAVSVWLDHRDPCPFEDEDGDILGDWEGWSAFTWFRMREDGWTPWGIQSEWLDWECPECGAYSGCSHYDERDVNEEPVAMVTT